MYINGKVFGINAQREETEMVFLKGDEKKQQITFFLKLQRHSGNQQFHIRSLVTCSCTGQHTVKVVRL